MYRFKKGETIDFQDIKDQLKEFEDLVLTYSDTYSRIGHEKEINKAREILLDTIAKYSSQFN